MKPLLVILALLLVLGSVADIDAGKRKKRTRTPPRLGIAVDGGPIVADTHDGRMPRAGNYGAGARFTQDVVPVYLYLDDALFRQQQQVYNDLAQQVAPYSYLPRFLLYQFPQESCAWVDANRIHRPAQSISVCQTSEIPGGWAGYVTVRDGAAGQQGRVLMQLDTEYTHDWQGVHCHEIMHAVGGAMDDYGSNEAGSCVHGWTLQRIGPDDIAFLRNLYASPPLTIIAPPTINQDGGINPDNDHNKKKRKKRR